jgi:hypothetical protein
MAFVIESELKGPIVAKSYGFSFHFYKRNASTEYDLSTKGNRFFFLWNVVLEIACSFLASAVVLD